MNDLANLAGILTASGGGDPSKSPLLNLKKKKKNKGQDVQSLLGQAGHLAGALGGKGGGGAPGGIPGGGPSNAAPGGRTPPGAPGGGSPLGAPGGGSPQQGGALHKAMQGLGPMPGGPLGAQAPNAITPSLPGGPQTPGSQGPGAVTPSLPGGPQTPGSQIQGLGSVPPPAQPTVQRPGGVGGSVGGPPTPLTGATRGPPGSLMGGQIDPGGAMLRSGLSFKPGAVDQFPTSPNVIDRRQGQPGGQIGAQLSQAPQIPPGPPGAGVGGSTGRGFGTPQGGDQQSSVAPNRWWTPDRISQATQFLQQNAGLSPFGAQGLVSRWANVEAPGGPSSVNPNSGAVGIGQWLGARKRGVGSDFASQLRHATQELRGPERKAASALRSASSPEEGARGASLFERAEGFNPRTGTDNFTQQTLRGIRSGGASSQLMQHAQSAIGQGADPAAVQSRMQELMQGGGRRRKRR